MGEALRVSDTSLRVVASRCAELAAKLSTTDLPSANSGLPCQPSTAAIGTLLADASAAQKAIASRMQDTSIEVGTAAAAYGDTDADSAARLGGQMV